MLADRVRVSMIGGGVDVKYMLYGARLVDVNNFIIEGVLKTSIDGINWIDINSTYPYSGAITDMIYGNGIYLLEYLDMTVTARYVYTTTDFVNYNYTGFSSESEMFPSYYGYANGTFFISTTNNNRDQYIINISTDCQNWQTYVMEFPLTSITYAFGKYYAYNYSNLLSSTDAINWVSENVTSTNGGLFFLNNMLILSNGIYDNNGFQTTTDGITWNTMPFGIRGSGTMEYSNGKYLLHIEDALYLSTDLVNWQSILLPEGCSAVSICALSGGEFLMSLNDNNSSSSRWFKIDVGDNIEELVIDVGWLLETKFLKYYE